MKDLPSALKTARKAANAGALVIMEQFGKVQQVRIKSKSNTLVTQTDKAAEAAILEVLLNDSEYSVLSEESGFTGKVGGPLWVVDPLDGTSNFARSLPLFGVSIALMEGAEIYAGVIIDPVHKMEYYAVKGGGAFCNGRSLKHENPVHPVPSLFLNHGAYAEDKEKYAGLTRLLSADFSLRKLGTTALELCYVASGMFDGFVCAGDEIWDFAAGALIASEAGYAFTDWYGHPWDGKKESIVVIRPNLLHLLISKTSTLF